MNQNKQTWRSDPRLQGIDDKKLNLLIDLLSQSESKKPEELIPFFLAATSTASSQGIEFSNDETDLILGVLKQNMSPQQVSQIDTVRKLSKMIAAKQKKPR